jgi:regulator of Ty1 transposition protein 103
LLKLQRLHIRELLLKSRASFAESSTCGKTETYLKFLFKKPLSLAYKAGAVPLSSTRDPPLANGCAELDKARGAPRSGFGGSIFTSSSVPSELAPLVAPQQNVSKLLLSTKAAINTANQEFDKVSDPSQPVPSATVYAARLNGLLKNLAVAEDAVAECVKARTELIGALEKILDTNKAALAEEEAQLHTFSSRKATIDQKKKDVEFAIMRGLNERDQSPQNGHSASPEPERPEVEALTPPSGHDDFYDEPGPAMPSQAEPQTTRSPVAPPQATFHHTAAPGIDLLSTLASQYQSVPVSANGANKRRRVDSNEEFPDLGNDDGIDADVAEMLRKDSQAS